MIPSLHDRWLDDPWLDDPWLAQFRLIGTLTAAVFTNFRHSVDKIQSRIGQDQQCLHAPGYTRGMGKAASPPQGVGAPV